jgi:hypothetical protein
MPPSQTKALGWSLARWSMACISGGRWLCAGRQCRRRHHEAWSTSATRLRREHGAGGGVSQVAFSDTSWTIRHGIMFSPVSAHIGAKRPVKEGPPLSWRPSAHTVAGNGPQSGPLPIQSQKELLWTAGGLHHRTTVVLNCQISGKQGISDVERLSKALETVVATVHQFASQLEVLL